MAAVLDARSAPASICRVATEAGIGIPRDNGRPAGRNAAAPRRLVKGDGDDGPGHQRPALRTDGRRPPAAESWFAAAGDRGDDGRRDRPLVRPAGHRAAPLADALERILGGMGYKPKVIVPGRDENPAPDGDRSKHVVRWPTRRTRPRVPSPLRHSAVRATTERPTGPHTVEASPDRGTGCCRLCDTYRGAVVRSGCRTNPSA